ncbi:hypothetical protein QYG06_17665 [Xanthomonas euvesicatoria]|nr:MULTISPECIES: hypothetical protein [Xanthomonas]MCC8586283.1 hypothetical protein [Xanthomonas euvesicatoria pv. euvesicatoria]MCC8595083.1 hypothetical protein [Xanthomonas euvesicatoria pv. euvesicatoria]MCC8726330.1 hypothetical protein [Xanthomonas euvesicatoria pv. euvesicatoria]MCC8746075.1 hypothetical protein [Xanthomonas euvesicatoria pv. euvesicatoria]MCC8762249.1 hypothetical protein [Xanthomonas euvesicatoria pv. euvesicatoria]
MTEISNLPQFLIAVAELLETIDRGKEVLFRLQFRRELSPVIEDTAGRLREFSERLYDVESRDYEGLYAAGLTDMHLSLKLESFQSSLQAFRDTAREDRLEETLEKSKTLLGSLAGAIPGFGSFAQELIEFLLKELKRRLFGRR